MKKWKITIYIIMAVLCFILSMVIFMQFKVVNETDITSIENMQQEELREELANWKKLYKEAEEQYNTKSDKLKEYRDNEQSSEETAQLVDKELDQANTYLGLTDVTGKGINVVVKGQTENNEDYVDYITAEDLLVIVDYLKLAGAEAISVNEQRIINTTDIVNLSDGIITVNQQRILAPYVIKAIGDQTNLESTLLGKGGYVDTLRNAGFDITIEKNNKIDIPKYNKDITSRYLN